ncbi:MULTISPECIES: hypothetical protein [Pseudanabaena]|uniref:Uncharacterized protein n=2 Tax=Pseudanabaena TaxID=1152 RepID=L8N3A6_9CYAN|nr:MULTISPECIES: hypothetical protein [Pseudanabaena]ELS34161.1 hypothetical protein Pse7429DRAFT_0643 [Pseudanabaena biceps PCC 7429]MDG3493634.1 hypothetical protein [Pseudanabaena catenata USMAC16]
MNLKLVGRFAATTIFPAILSLVYSSLPANAENRAVSLIGGKQIEVIDEVFINTSQADNGQLVSEIMSISDSRYKVEDVVQGSGSYILQTSDSNESSIASIERIRDCLKSRPQLYTLAKVKNVSTGEIKTLGIPLKFNGEHGTIRLNAKGKPICPA